MIKALYITAAAFLFTSCGSVQRVMNPPKINMAETAVSQNFSIKAKKKVALSPFVNEGREGFDSAAADKLGLKLMNMGFTVVERSQLEQVFKEHKLNYTGTISSKDLKQIGEILSIDMIVLGTNKYAYVRGQNSHRKKLVSQSVRFVDIETGEVMIGSYCCEVKVARPQLSYIIESIQTSIE